MNTIWDAWVPQGFAPAHAGFLADVDAMYPADGKVGADAGWFGGEDSYLQRDLYHPVQCAVARTNVHVEGWRADFAHPRYQIQGPDVASYGPAQHC